MESSFAYKLMINDQCFLCDMLPCAANGTLTIPVGQFGPQNAFGLPCRHP